MTTDPTEHIVELIDMTLCDDCDPFTSYAILQRLEEHGYQVVKRHEVTHMRLHLAACLHVLESRALRRMYAGDDNPIHMRVLRPALEDLWDDFGGWPIDDIDVTP